MSNQNNLVKLSSSYDQDFFDSNILVNGRIVGELIVIPRRHIALSRSFPAVSLTRIKEYADLTSAVAPDFHSIMRNEFIEIEDDADTFHDEFGVQTIAGQDITLNDTPENNRILADLYEDALVNNILKGGDTETPNYANWMPLTGDNGVDYSITGVNVGTRTITVSGSIGAFTYVKFSQYRVGGDSSRVRVFSQRGRALTGASGGIGLASGLRRRDQMQGHYHRLVTELDIFGDSGAGGYGYRYDLTGSFTDTRITNPVTDGTNGTPRTGTTTHSPEFATEVYQWLGRYLG